jgi:hypothetical protein
MVKHFLSLGLKSSSSGFRQNCSGLLRKFFLRLKESARRKYHESSITKASFFR